MFLCSGIEASLRIVMKNSESCLIVEIVDSILNEMILHLILVMCILGHVIVLFNFINGFVLFYTSIKNDIYW